MDKEGRIKPGIKPEGLWYTAYRSFLNMCRIRNVEKGKRYALPACAVNRIRDLYPSENGVYVNFEAIEYATRIN